MPFKKGESGNPKGRPTGAKNRATELVKSLIEEMITDNSDQLKTDFAALKGRDKIKAFTDLLPYVVPRLQSTSLDIDLEKLSDEQLDELYTRIINTAK